MIRLEAHGHRLTLSAEHGGTLMSLDWQQPDGHWLPILEPLADPAAGKAAGSFVMAPFANRIADGQFVFQGETRQLPLNRPEEGMAIHGFARDRAWQVLEVTANHARLAVLQDNPALPWRFDLEQRISLTPAGVDVALVLTNQGAAAMPFGMGLHPWFRKVPGAMLSFVQAESQTRDARGLPLPARESRPEFAPATAQALDRIRRFDGIFADWPSRQARICWPQQETEIRLTASGALRHLHVFVPDDRPVFCAEPVSHLPDAINRPDLPQMDVLAPGARLTGSMQLSIRQIPSDADPVQQEKSS